MLTGWEIGFLVVVLLLLAVVVGIMIFVFRR
jgi:hypothetical protein